MREHPSTLVQYLCFQTYLNLNCVHSKTQKGNTMTCIEYGPHPVEHFLAINLCQNRNRFLLTSFYSSEPLSSHYTFISCSKCACVSVQVTVDSFFFYSFQHSQPPKFVISESHYNNYINEFQNESYSCKKGQYRFLI